MFFIKKKQPVQTDVINQSNHPIKYRFSTHIRATPVLLYDYVSSTSSRHINVPVQLCFEKGQLIDI